METAETRERRGWLAATIAAVGAALAIVASFLQFGSGPSLKSEATGESINPQPTIAFGGLDDWLALAAGVVMLVGAVAFLVLRGRIQSLVSAGMVGASALLALAFGIKVALDIGGSGFDLGLRLETEAGEIFTGTLDESIAIGVWLLIAGAVIGLVAAVLMVRAARRRPPTAEAAPA
jgi:hypothetical protein